jgi:osmotically-inducible protein OsmY
MTKTSALRSRVALAAFASLLAVGSLGTLGGCTVARGQASVGDVIDDSTITTKLKAKYAEDPSVSTMAISVETLKGVVQLAGFAKNETEKAMAEKIARDTKGVVDVKNSILVRP